MSDSRIILIGGSSHAGKSTLAQSLAAKLGSACVSTDYLARHPGRPWRVAPEAVPPHVAEHYGSLSTDELIEDVLRHYRSLWPRIESVITVHRAANQASGLVIEGSALWPESVASLRPGATAAVWLTASDALFQARIYHESRFEEADAHGKKLIENFLARTLRYNGQMMEAVRRLGLASVDVEQASSLDDLSSLCLDSLSPQLEIGAAPPRQR